MTILFCSKSKQIRTLWFYNQGEWSWNDQFAQHIQPHARIEEADQTAEQIQSAKWADLGRERQENIRGRIQRERLERIHDQ